MNAKTQNNWDQNGLGILSTKILASAEAFASSHSHKQILEGINFLEEEHKFSLEFINQKRLVLGNNIIYLEYNDSPVGHVEIECESSSFPQAFAVKAFNYVRLDGEKVSLFNELNKKLEFIINIGQNTSSPFFFDDHLNLIRLGGLVNLLSFLAAFHEIGHSQYVFPNELKSRRRLNAINGLINGFIADSDFENGFEIYKEKTIAYIEKRYGGDGVTKEDLLKPLTSEDVDNILADELRACMHSIVEMIKMLKFLRINPEEYNLQIQQSIILTLANYISVIQEKQLVGKSIPQILEERYEMLNSVK